MNPELSKEETTWESVCCNASARGELSFAWWEIKPGGEAHLMREGICAACGERSNFVEEPN